MRLEPLLVGGRGWSAEYAAAAGRLLARRGRTAADAMITGMIPPVRRRV